MRIAYIRPNLFAALLRDEADAEGVTKAESKILRRIADLVEHAEDDAYVMEEREW